MNSSDILPLLKPYLRLSEALGFDVRTLDTARAMQSTVSVQLAILTVGVATARAFNRAGL